MSDLNLKSNIYFHATFQEDPLCGLPIDATHFFYLSKKLKLSSGDSIKSSPTSVPSSSEHKKNVFKENSSPLPLKPSFSYGDWFGLQVRPVSIT